MHVLTWIYLAFLRWPLPRFPEPSRQCQPLGAREYACSHSGRVPFPSDAVVVLVHVDAAAARRQDELARLVVRALRARARLLLLGRPPGNPLPHEPSTLERPVHQPVGALLAPVRVVPRRERLYPLEHGRLRAGLTAPSRHRGDAPALRIHLGGLSRRPALRVPRGPPLYGRVAQGRGGGRSVRRGEVDGRLANR